MIKILSIGNSFSQDATRYLHQIAKADNCEIKTVNLYIGGCPLYKHYINAIEDRNDYLMEFNGQNTGFRVSIMEALVSDEWDIVTLQQLSSKSVDYETYQPYLDYMKSYINKYSPKAKIYMHQTWAYEKGSDRLCNELGYTNETEMLSDIKSAYKKAAEDIKAEGIIPSGELFDDLLKNGIQKIHRDTFHATLGLGRYALGMLWYAFFSGNDISNNAFSETDEPITGEEIEIVKKSVNSIIKRR